MQKIPFSQSVAGSGMVTILLDMYRRAEDEKNRRAEDEKKRRAEEEEKRRNEEEKRINEAVTVR